MRLWAGKGAMWPYKEGEDNVAQIALRACHCVPALRLLREPLALFGKPGALHFVCSRGVAGEMLASRVAESGAEG